VIGVAARRFFLQNFIASSQISLYRSPDVSWDAACGWPSALAPALWPARVPRGIGGSCFQTYSLIDTIQHLFLSVAAQQACSRARLFSFIGSLSSFEVTHTWSINVVPAASP
jgi:hypothetical protein